MVMLSADKESNIVEEIIVPVIFDVTKFLL